LQGTNMGKSPHAILWTALTGKHEKLKGKKTGVLKNLENLEHCRGERVDDLTSA